MGARTALFLVLKIDRIHMERVQSNKVDVQAIQIRPQSSLDYIVFLSRPFCVTMSLFADSEKSMRDK